MPTTEYLIVSSGEAGPAGSTGPAGPAGPAGATVRSLGATGPHMSVVNGIAAAFLGVPASGVGEARVALDTFINGLSDDVAFVAWRVNFGAYSADIPVGSIEATQLVFNQLNSSAGTLIVDFRYDTGATGPASPFVSTYILLQDNLGIGL